MLSLLIIIVGILGLVAVFLAILKWYVGKLRDAGWAILLELKHSSGEMSAFELAQSCGKPRIFVQTSLLKLAQGGFVRRNSGTGFFDFPADLYGITVEGLTLLEFWQQKQAKPNQDKQGG